MHYLEITLFVEPRKSVGHFLNAAAASVLAPSVSDRSALWRRCALRRSAVCQLTFHNNTHQDVTRFPMRMFWSCINAAMMIVYLHAFYVYLALHKGLFTELGVNKTGLHTDWAKQATAQGPQTPPRGWGGFNYPVCQLILLIWLMSSMFGDLHQ